jgi:hypothetical protein
LSLITLVISGLSACAAPVKKTTQPTYTTAPTKPLKNGNTSSDFELFRDYGRLEARTIFKTERAPLISKQTDPIKKENAVYLDFADKRADEATDDFLKGRYNRSKARLPENVEVWRSSPDVSNPGPDLANFPNSAFTLPQGRAYIELAPASYAGPSKGAPAQFSSQFLLRYGLTDDVELRVFGNGETWTGGATAGWNFSPLVFDTKIQLWTEKEEYFLPAMAFEGYIQTEWLGSTNTNEGTQPSLMLNFDQSLPFDIDFEYNLGTVRTNYLGENEWKFSFQWAFQRDLFNKDFAVFIHGYYNAASLPRVPNQSTPTSNAGLLGASNISQNVVGAGAIWTINSRLAIFTQTSAGTNSYSPSIITFGGLTVAF